MRRGDADGIRSDVTTMTTGDVTKSLIIITTY